MLAYWRTSNLPPRCCCGTSMCDGSIGKPNFWNLKSGSEGAESILNSFSTSIPLDLSESTRLIFMGDSSSDFIYIQATGYGITHLQRNTSIAMNPKSKHHKLGRGLTACWTYCRVGFNSDDLTKSLLSSDYPVEIMSIIIYIGVVFSCTGSLSSYRHNYYLMDLKETLTLLLLINSVLQ
mgnify:CR=1 FL=1